MRVLHFGAFIFTSINQVNNQCIGILTTMKKKESSSFKEDKIIFFKNQCEVDTNVTHIMLLHQIHLYINISYTTKHTLNATLSLAIILLTAAPISVYFICEFCQDHAY